MIIYVDQVLIDNFIINLLIFLTIRAMLKVKIKSLNMCLSSLFGSIISLFLPLLKLNFLLNVMAKIIISLLMTTMLKKFTRIREFVLFYLCFLLVTFTYGGACLFILFAFDKNFNINNGATYSLPLGAILLIIFFIFILIKNIFNNFYKRKTKNNYIYSIKVTNGDKIDKFDAFLDTGNCLVDSLTNKPITIVNFFALKNILRDISLADIVLGKEQKLSSLFCNVHTINVQSISSNFSKIYVFEIEKLEIYLENDVHIINNACIGLSIKEFATDLDYKALLNPILFERF